MLDDKFNVIHCNTNIAQILFFEEDELINNKFVNLLGENSVELFNTFMKEKLQS